MLIDKELMSVNKERWHFYLNVNFGRKRKRKSGKNPHQIIYSDLNAAKQECILGQNSSQDHLCIKAKFLQRVAAREKQTLSNRMKN